jgi:dTMP kinase
MLFTFEGIDGSGKSTQATLVADYLEKELGHKVVRTFEPGDGEFNKYIRQLIMGDQVEKPVPLAETMLYLADRVQHVEKTIKPALAEGKIVVCDRYIDSFMAYQGYGMQQDLRVLSQLNSIASQGIIPHRTFLLDLEVSMIPERMLKRTGKLPKLTADEKKFFSLIRDGYRTIAKSNLTRFKVIQAQKAPETITNLIIREINATLKKVPISV